MKYLLMIVLLFSFNQAAALVFLTGSKLLEKCEAHLSETGNIAKGNVCVGFVAGIVDAHDTFTGWDKMSPLWCPPDNMGTGQLTRVVTKHLQEHPQDLHLSAGSLVANALILAFPCE